VGREEGIYSTKSLPVQNTENTDKAEGQKSMSCERTFTTTSDKKDIYCKLYDICMSIAPKIKSKGLKPQTLSLKIKTASFDIINRSITPEQYTVFDDGDELFAVAKSMLDKLFPMKVRLIGVTVSKFRFPKQKEGSSIATFFDDKTKVVNSEVATTDYNADFSPFFSEKSGSINPINNSYTINGISQYENVDDEWSMCSIVDNSSTAGHASAKRVEEGSYMCPICNISFDLTLYNFNCHVDECLTRAALEDEKSYSNSGSCAPSAGSSVKGSRPSRIDEIFVPSCSSSSHASLTYLDRTSTSNS
jgi:hypothetical protein